MDISQKALIYTLLIFSVLIFAVPLGCVFYRTYRSKVLHKSNVRSSISIALIISASLIVSVWCLRFTVGYYQTLLPNSEYPDLTWWEEIMNSIIHALQTFSMDEDYTQYIQYGKQMIAELTYSNSPWVVAYGLYASMLNFIAPIAGGAIILDILAGVFPKIKLFFVFWNSRRTKLYFSELNEASLALAKSWCSAGMARSKKPIIIFTDVYTDNEERSAELLSEAKSIGAICVQDDIIHLHKNKRGEKFYFLMDEKEYGNLDALIGMTNEDNIDCLRNAEVYFFVSDYSYVRIAEEVMERVKKSISDEDERPLILAVNSYRNLIWHLLVNVAPLYEPLINKERNEDGTQSLTVTILGRGHIGTQMFLSVYCLGQMLNCELNINIVSQESEEEFWGKIDYINPEIRKSMQRDDPLLLINQAGDRAAAYGNVQYFQCDVRSSQFIGLFNGDNKTGIADTDYFLVSLGDDAMNISTADTIKNYIGEHYVQSGHFGKALIAYIVYNSELSNILNKNTHFSVGRGSSNIIMRAVGSVSEVNDKDIVMMNGIRQQVSDSYKAYIAAGGKINRRNFYNRRVSKGEYDYWSTQARVLHKKYKMYSVGMFGSDACLFSYSSFDDGDYLRAVDAAQKRYIKWVNGDVHFSDDNDKQAHITKLHELAWLEKRRWNAFMRTIGFRHTDNYLAYADPSDPKSYKQMQLKLHPCLVECDKNGIKAEIDEHCKIGASRLIHSNAGSFEITPHTDFLDALTCDLHKNGFIDYDFKLYDYPNEDINS